MKKRVLAILLIFTFVFASTAGVYAKGFRSFGGSRSFSKSFSSSSKSVTKKSGGLFGSSKAKSSSSRAKPGSTASSGSSAKGFASKSTSKKYSYMQDTYKKQVSSKNFNTYKQKLNTDQQKVYNDSLKRDYGTSSRRMGFEDAMNTRSSRINTFSNSRPIFINVNRGMFASPFSYGYAYVGPWDLWFLMRASDMFWFHHWNEISPYRSYFDQQKYDELEKKVEDLEKQGVKRDPNYLDPDVDPDLQLSQQYQEQNVDKLYYTDKYPTNSGSAGTAIVVIIITSVALVIVIKKISKPKRKKSHYSRIY
ncbi:MAG: hypothetical protein ACYDG2_26235 [Ruminiclostridium sp.]